MEPPGSSRDRLGARYRTRDRAPDRPQAHIRPGGSVLPQVSRRLVMAAYSRPRSPSRTPATHPPLLQNRERFGKRGNGEGGGRLLFRAIPVRDRRPQDTRTDTLQWAGGWVG